MNALTFPRRVSLLAAGWVLAGNAHAALETAGQAIGLMSIGAVIVMAPGAVVGALLTRFAPPGWRKGVALAVFLGLWAAFALAGRNGAQLHVVLLNPVIVFAAIPYAAGCALGMRLARRRVPASACQPSDE
ncbi:MAG: hypothetical protein RJA98_462 [Pseudomonadota bacterium]|jgi:hypothetical protein